MEHKRSPKRPKMKPNPVSFLEPNLPPGGLTEWSYKILLLPNPIPEKLDVKDVKFKNPRKVLVTPEQIAFYNNVKEKMGADLFDKTAEILGICRTDWNVLRPSSQAFLINRMIDRKYTPSLCCQFFLVHMRRPCPCMMAPNRLCCYKEKELCKEVHTALKPFDYIVWIEEPSTPAEK